MLPYFLVVLERKLSRNHTSLALFLDPIFIQLHSEPSHSFFQLSPISSVNQTHRRSMMTRTSYYGAGAALVATALLSAQVQASADLFTPHRVAHRHIHSHVRRALPSGWSARGCVTDAPPPSRGLDQSHTDAALTPAACIKSCAASGYVLAGTQFSKECWCGGALNTTGGAGQNAAASDCNMPCAGDASQNCGGNYHMNLYALLDSSASSSSSAAPTSTSAYSTPSATGKSYAVKDRFSGKTFFK